MFSITLILLLSACVDSSTDPEDGVDGTNGFNALVATAEEPAGTNCTEGGVSISIGQDLNTNGILDESEVISISYVCNGSAGTGTNGLSLVARTSAENPGDNCEYGGTLVEIGADANGNLTLDDEEVQTTYFVCNGSNGNDGSNGSDGTNGLTSLLRATSESPGANCANGGVKIDLGLDSNEDGSLDDDEVQSTYYLCNGADGNDGSNGTNGTNGLNSLMQCTIEPSGPNCPAGGFLIEIGLDTNENGILDGDEVIGTPKYLCHGADGADGTNGTDGKSPIVTTTPNPSECGNGGFEISIGFDNTGDGSIDELLETLVICNGLDGASGSDGANGTDGKSLVIRKTAEPSSENCPSGGTYIEIGQDDNDNNAFDEGETDTDFYVCNGADGNNGSDGSSIVITTSAASCSGAGGYTFTVSYDDNNDGIGDRVIGNYTICNGSNGNSDNIYEFYISEGYNGYSGVIDLSIGLLGGELETGEYDDTLSVDFQDGTQFNSLIYFPGLTTLIDEGVRGEPFEIVEAILYLKAIESEVLIGISSTIF